MAFGERFCCREESRESEPTVGSISSAWTSTSSAQGRARRLQVVGHSEAPLSARLRRKTTIDAIRDGRTQSGVKFRLATRSDVQEAVMWMEGKEGMGDDDEEPVMGFAQSIRNRWQAAAAQSDEEKAEEKRSCQWEERHRLPALLLTSLLLGALCVFFLHRQLVEEWFGGVRVFSLCFALVYGLTLLSMAYTALVDAGQLDPQSTFAIKQKWPERSHKAWQYNRPIRRYDHYCRWVTNCIGLSNHREFFIMITGFAGVAALGTILDLALLFRYASVERWVATSGVVLHLMYSLTFGYYVLPIYRLHVTFISRNELAQEWKNDLFYVVRDALTGEAISVQDLDGDEFEEHYDHFEYEPSLNPYDHGCYLPPLAAHGWIRACDHRRFNWMVLVLNPVVGALPPCVAQPSHVLLQRFAMSALNSTCLGARSGHGPRRGTGFYWTWTRPGRLAKA